MDFFSAIWGEAKAIGELRLIHDGKTRQAWGEIPKELDALVEIAMREDRMGVDVYFGVLPRTQRIGRNEAIADETSVLWADVDGKSFGTQVGAFNALSRIAPRPQIVVDSGNGYHAYWLLDDLYPFEEAQQAMKGIALEAGADRTYDKARILRIPGTHNHKDKTNPKPVRLLRFNLMGRRHRLSDFVDYAERAAFVDQRRSSRSRPATTDAWDPSQEDAPKFPEGERNNGLARLAGIMVARGLDDDEMLVQLGHENQMRCDPPLPDREVVAIVRSVGRYRQ